ncbi:MAG: hypothetical protein ABIK65_00460 [Candidatus Eisenbacteria bacterium]
MPCDDSTSRIEVLVDGEERLIGYRYRKITCSKEIGGGTGLEPFCAGRPVEDLLALSFDEALAATAPTDEEDRFFVFLEWDALRAALSCYRGEDPGGDHGRYRIASIEHDPEGTLIRLDVRPPADLPPIRPCFSPGAKVPAALPLAGKDEKPRGVRPPS